MFTLVWYITSVCLSIDQILVKIGVLYTFRCAQAISESQFLQQSYDNVCQTKINKGIFIMFSSFNNTQWGKSLFIVYDIYSNTIHHAMW